MRVALLALVLSLLCGAAARAQPVLLTPVHAPALSDGERAVIDDAVRAEVIALGTVEVIGRDEQRAHCEAIACDGALACSVARGQRARASSVLVVQIPADGRSVRMTLIDVAAAMERHNAVVDTARTTLRQGVREAVVRTLAPERAVGRVNVELVGVAAEVVIDGVAVGKTPLLAAIAVAPGRHEIEVRAPAVAPYRGFIDVAFDAVVTVPLELVAGALVRRAAPVEAPDVAASGPPPVADEPIDPLRTAGIVTAVVGGAALIGGAVVTLVALDQKARFERNAASVEEIRANLVLGPTGLVLIGAGVLGAAVGASLIGASVALAEPSDDATAQ